MKRFFLLIAIITLTACGGSQSSNNTAEKENKEDILPQDDELKMHPDYPDIPLAEKGITLVNKNGWDEGTLDFHQGYCQQMMSSIEDSVDTYVFCNCFLTKIQYYYPPTFFKEAYEDQVLWNQMCYRNGYFAKKEFYEKQQK